MTEKNFLTKTLTDTVLSRRSFLKWGAALGGTAALAGGLNSGLKVVDKAAAASEGKWVPAPCWHNCGGTRCLLKAYVVDGVPVRIKSDDDVEFKADYDNPHRRACPRGRAQIQHVMAGERLKYPMKRKNWEPGGGKKELRGKDEWVRISWEEALDIAASETKRITEKYGKKSIFAGSWGGGSWSLGMDNDGEILWDPTIRVFNALESLVGHFGTISFATWPWDEIFMQGGLGASGRMELRDAKLIVLVGCNWTSNRASLASYWLKQAKDNGAKVIIIDPWLNQTAEGLADQWIGVYPGTDTALFLGVAYHMITNNLQDQEFLDKYCSGFDAEHMPEGAPKEDNFKDYVLGTHDGEPKTPEWASSKCGVHPSVIRDLAVQISSVKPVTFHAGLSTGKFPAGDQWAQTYYTVAWMTGNVGFSGAQVSAFGHPFDGGPSLVTSGRYGDPKFVNPLMPKAVFTAIIIPTDKDWECMEYSEVWKSIVEGEYGRDIWPGGKRKINIQMIYHGHGHFLNSMPDVNKGIEAHRKVEFVMANCLHFNTNAKYADLVFPISTLWERQGQVWGGSTQHVFWWQNVMEPLFESKPDLEVARGMAERLGLDADAIYGNSYPQKEFNTLVGSQVMKTDGSGYEPLVTITEADIKAMGVEGTPQQGRITVDEFRQAGIYRVPRKKGDKLGSIKDKAFRDDPVANPLPTASGKLEIYCPTLSGFVNSFGFSTISPIGKWQEAEPDHGNHARTKEYPLLLFTPHSLRRAHTQLDCSPSLREAFPQECFMSEIDAEARGIKTGDVVLMTSPYGKVLRPAKILPGMMPGVAALQDGAWTMIDEATGIDLAGDPSVLQGMRASSAGGQCYSGTLLQIEKYEGPLELLPDAQWAPRTIKFAEG
jgi:anaerobic dimethyl sulfoxide reductase subunit A